MKDGTRYADRLKKAFAKVKGGIGKDVSEPRDPVEALALGILGSDHGQERAMRVLNKLKAAVVDWNEIRVSNVHEVAELAGDTGSESLRRCQHLLDALNAIYDRENKVSLDRLKTFGRREARQYLETLKGVDEYGVAYVVLWSLGGHAIPVWNNLLSSLRAAELVHPEASRAEIQAFLERNVSAADAKAFSVLVGSLGSAKAAARKKNASPKAKKREAAK